MRWLDVLTGSKPSDLYGVRVLKDAPAALAAPVSAFRPHVDRSKMAVTAVLTTDDPDRQGDIIDPSGGDFSEHQTNPVVMFHHGKTHKLPIGKAEDRDGNYTVRLVETEDGPVLVGTTHFAQSNRFASDVFGLVAEDILRGVSIGFDPLNDPDCVEELGESPTLKRPALHFKGWKLLEYSHTPIGVNRDALTVAVHKALDGSRKLHPKLLAMLEPLAGPRRETVTSGFEKGAGCASMSKKQKTAVAIARANANSVKGKKKPIPPARVEKAMPQNADDDEDDTMPQNADDGDQEQDQGADSDPGAGADFDPTTDDPSQDPSRADASYGDDDANREPPPTVQTLSDAAQGIMDLCSEIGEGMKKSEHMKGRKFASKLCDELRRRAAEVTSFVQKVQSELEAAPGAEPEPDDETSEGDDGDDSVPMEPETDEDGAVVTKGYTPRRWTYADLVGTAPAIQPTGDARQLKAVQRENAELKRAMENLLNDLEAGERRGR